MLRDKEAVVRRLTAKPVPRAVRWYDPGVLVRVGLRHVMAETFGEYADQRLIQAATDSADKDELPRRYDYWTGSKPVIGPDNACWVDYIADVGDGFGPTFGMASLLAQKKLTLANPPDRKLPAGRILILGGDQCYPQATHEEYEERLVLPYATALPPPDRPSPDNPQPDGSDRQEERLLFAVPGNHDWYDGLGAFDHLFCQNRDRLLGRGFGRRIGGWRCQQHRSYWAIRLPHNWWLWGVDIQFSKYLDPAQESYFRAVVDSMKGGSDTTEFHNVILCIAEPHWLNAEFEGVDTVGSLHTIVRIAQRSAKDPLSPNREVRVRAVLAGDWHHYSHYRLDDLYDPQTGAGEKDEPKLKDQGIHLITAGGGGAFLHSTTDLRKEIPVSWGVREESAPEQPAASPAGGRRLRRRFTGKARMVACYPGRGRSALLSLKNLAFPLRNWRFSLVLGALYWIMTWQYHLAVKTSGDLKALNGLINTADYDTINSVSNQLIASLHRVAAENILFCVMLVGLWAGLVSYVSVSEKRTPLFGLLAKIGVGSLHALAHLKAMFLIFVLCTVFNRDTEIGEALGIVAYPLEAIPLGALLGGFVFGAYWVLAGLIARMHTGDAFGALGIRNYKNFLRMRFDVNGLTIYPIGIDKLPSTRWCNRKLKRKPPGLGSDPLLAIKPLKPFLIPGRNREGRTVAEPIVIPRIPGAAVPEQKVEPARVAAE